MRHQPQGTDTVSGMQRLQVLFQSAAGAFQGVRQQLEAGGGVLEHMHLRRHFIFIGQTIIGVQLGPHPGQLGEKRLAPREHDALVGGFALQRGGRGQLGDYLSWTATYDLVCRLLLEKKKPCECRGQNPVDASRRGDCPAPYYTDLSMSIFIKNYTMSTTAGAFSGLQVGWSCATCLARGACCGRTEGQGGTAAWQVDV